MKKGRHRRFEEARKLKQSGPGAFDLGFGDRSRGRRRPPPRTRTTTTPPWPRSTASSSTTTTTTTTDRRLIRRRSRRRGAAPGAAAAPSPGAPAARPACRRRAGRRARRSRRATIRYTGSVADERLGRLGAPPVELGAALAPVAPLPLPQPRREVAVLVGRVLEADRHLPAHVRLPVERPLAGLEGADVQGAAGAAGEAGPVEEDAGVVDEAGHGRPRRRRRRARPGAGTRPGGPWRGTASGRGAGARTPATTLATSSSSTKWAP